MTRSTVLFIRVLVFLPSGGCVVLLPLIFSMLQTSPSPWLWGENPHVKTFARAEGLCPGGTTFRLRMAPAERGAVSSDEIDVGKPTSGPLTEQSPPRGNETPQRGGPPPPCPSEETPLRLLRRVIPGWRLGRGHENALLASRSEGGERGLWQSTPPGRRGRSSSTRDPRPRRGDRKKLTSAVRSRFFRIPSRISAPVSRCWWGVRAHASARAAGGRASASHHHNRTVSIRPDFQPGAHDVSHSL
jgi:hypothetical protein